MLFEVTESKKPKVHFSYIMAATKHQLESLQKALSYDHAPLCSGAISPPPEGFYLYYGKRNPKRVSTISLSRF